jgi:crotonobetainyl-CoA:carnitine CoA-transferase CaiB-like acyl-CoA transferase
VPYNSLEGLMEDPHLTDVGFFRIEDHPTEGRVKRTALPNRFSGGEREDEMPAPRLGADTRAVLAEAGYGSAQIDAMIAEGAAQEPVRGGSR